MINFVETPKIEEEIFEIPKSNSLESIIKHGNIDRKKMKSIFPSVSSEGKNSYNILSIRLTFFNA